MQRFREVQAFRDSGFFWPIAAVVVVGEIVLWKGIDSFSSPAVWIPAALTGACLLWFASMQLVTEVGNDELRVKFERLWPERRIPVTTIAKAAATTYRPIVDYGGWGVRGFPRVRAFNVRGSRGVLLEFHDGRRLMIGSQRPQELEAAIHERLAAARN